MCWIATLAVSVSFVVLSAMPASGQYTFGNWATDQGYSPGAILPGTVDAQSSSIDSLDGIGEFDWTSTPTTELDLANNEILSIESGHFNGLTNLERLDLHFNDISSIELGDFGGLANLERLYLQGNEI